VFLEEALALLERFDVLLAPATPFTATPIGQASIELGGATVSVRANLGLYAQPLSCIGLPVVVAPVAAGTLPGGVQLVAAPWGEARLLRLAHALERRGVVGAPALPIKERAHAHQ
jgi:Asp-tRNA(Asn)/Glu-tRNA(Gln) amidotransferase A subunit family amidase